MKKLVSCFVAASLLALGGSAVADLCTIEATPAATLLLPYFEVPLSGNTRDVLFSINNASRSSVLAHVTIWSDMSVEAIDFNIYLTGFDVQTISLGQLIRSGSVPQTSTSLSPRGLWSAAHPTLPAACSSLLPPGTVPAAKLAHMQALLTGNPSSIYLGNCGGFPYGDNVARGYVTVDHVVNCTTLSPCDVGYFSNLTGTPGTGVAGYANVLWGEWYAVNYAQNFMQGDTLVHLEAASPSDTLGISLISDGTFWNRCSNDWFFPGGAITPHPDLRESLGTTYASQFYTQFGAPTTYMVWKDSQWPEPTNQGYPGLGGFPPGFDCDAGPVWFPLPESQIVFFNEREDPVVPDPCRISPCPPVFLVQFPIEAQAVTISQLGVPTATTHPSGWMYANLNQDFGLSAVVLAQAWVQSVHSAFGLFSAGLNAIQLDNFCDQSSIILSATAAAPECAVNWFNGTLYNCAPSGPIQRQGQGGYFPGN